jgi:hypothetical protein
MCADLYCDLVQRHRPSTGAVKHDWGEDVTGSVAAQPSDLLHVPHDVVNVICSAGKMHPLAQHCMNGEQMRMVRMQVHRVRSKIHLLSVARVMPGEEAVHCIGV